jgi:hypothetical protein
VATDRRAQRKALRFYARALTEAERADLPLALEMEGMAEEAAVLRLRLRKALRDHPDDMALMLRGIEVLSRTLARRYHLGEREADAVVEGMLDALNEFRLAEEAKAKEASRG